MKIERFDHVHIKAPDFNKFTEAFEAFMGQEFFLKMDMTEEYGSDVIYEPFPIGVEAFDPKDPTKSISGKLAGESPIGVFVICFKVSNLEEAQAEMEAMGYKKLEHYDNGPIQEALFDTKDDFGFNTELIEYPFESLRDMAGG
jgi:catechol 2,3-dioxygenase-like lactoylglutathione lyase family enzyme